MFDLHGVIDVVSKQRQLPRQFWLFQRLRAWVASTRSGIWTYYESTSPQDCEEIAGAMERFGLLDVAAKYRSGMQAWPQPGGCDALDRWIDDNWSTLEATAFQLIANDRHHLYDAC